MPRPRLIPCMGIHHRPCDALKRMGFHPLQRSTGTLPLTLPPGKRHDSKIMQRNMCAVDTHI
eukprot:scaffold2142_cov327-Pavlova_lutheri.AAC.9